MSAALLPLQEVLGGQVRPLRRADYDRLVDAGVFEGEPIELLEGFLVEMSPEGPTHVFVIDRLTELLVSALAGRYLVRVGHPLALGERSEPEPDVAVVPRDDYRHSHPRTALLVIESASSSRRQDLGFKAQLYARHGIPEYWVADLDAAQVVVHTGPGPDGYAQITRHGTGVRLSPTTIDELMLAVDDFLP
jgi:Uma2 family endonuclease